MISHTFGCFVYKTQRRRVNILPFSETSCEDEDVKKSLLLLASLFCGLFMKFLFSFSFIALFLIAAVVSLSQRVQAVQFECNYGYRFDHGYPCQITKGILDNPNEEVTFFGNHKSGKDDNDLKLISFSGNRLLRLRYFPREAFSNFPQLNDFSLQNCQLRYLRNGDFQDAGNLINLNLDLNEIVQVNATTFKGAVKLEWLSMSSNLIDSINKDAFKGLSKLQMLVLSQNKLHQLHRETFYDLVDLTEILLNGNALEIMEAGLFDHNIQLRRIWLQNNQLRSIEPNLLKPLDKLVFINLENNICINQLFRKQYRETELLMTQELASCKITVPAKAYE